MPTTHRSTPESKYPPLTPAGRDAILKAFANFKPQAHK
jgi:hypothetical protein